MKPNLTNKIFKLNKETLKNFNPKCPQSKMPTMNKKKERKEIQKIFYFVSLGSVNKTRI